MNLFILVEVSPNGAQTVRSVFQADSLKKASAYAEQQNTSDLDKLVQRFRAVGPFRYADLEFDPEEGKYFLGL